MPQLSLYMDEMSMDLLRKQAEAESVSLSQYARGILINPTANSWPKGFWDLYGSLQDDSFVAPEELNFADDAPRLEW